MDELQTSNDVNDDSVKIHLLTDKLDESTFEIKKNETGFHSANQDCNGSIEYLSGYHPFL